MSIDLPWSRQQVVALASITKLDALYQLLGEQTPRWLQIATVRLRERALACGGVVYPSLSHQLLVRFPSPRKALDWVESAPSVVMQYSSELSEGAKPGVVVGFDCADTAELEGVLHTKALHRLERLMWGRTDELVFTHAALAIIPPELQGRITRVPGPKELGSVWRIGVKESAVFSGLATQPVRAGMGTSAGTVVNARPVLLLEMLDRKVRLEGTDDPLIIGRNTAGGFDIPDPRVSRVHSQIQPRGSQFVLVDSSSNGTWVHFDGHPVAVELRQQECLLHGKGVITFGVAAQDFSAPSMNFAVSLSGGVTDSGFESMSRSTRGALLADS
jgi:adenylate cyclase